MAARSNTPDSTCGTPPATTRTFPSGVTRRLPAVVLRSWLTAYSLVLGLRFRCRVTPRRTMSMKRSRRFAWFFLAAAVGLL